MKNVNEMIIKELETRGFSAKEVKNTRGGVTVVGIEVICPTGAPSVCPVFYPGQIGEGSVPEFVNQVLEQVKCTPSFPKELFEWENIKNNMVVCLRPVVDDDTVSAPYLDVQQYIRVIIAPDKSFKLTKSLAATFPLTEDQLFELAKKNTKKQFSMNTFVNRFPFLVNDSEDAPRMNIAECGVAGASAMMFLKDNLKTDAVILPSSIFEVIVLPPADKAEIRYMKKMVEDINRSNVLPEERLSDNVYLYHAEDGTITIA